MKLFSRVGALAYLRNKSINPLGARGGEGELRKTGKLTASQASKLSHLVKLSGPQQSNKQINKQKYHQQQKVISVERVLHVRRREEVK